ncbi:MAG: phosphoribosylformylglycinamidine synthase subunit PurL [Candidatus Omnitrophica bacterium]|nr:phosphoribosylformylglycinamidine synthase subunit PurL [Candidatus Omnitrophota bacterium]
MREGLVDGEAEGLKSDIADLGVSGVDKVVIARVYYLRGKLQEAELHKLGAQLLADPITDEWKLTSSPFDSTAHPELVEGERSAQGEWTHTVEVAYRPGVRDPVEDSLKKGAADLGVTGIEAVHTAKAYTLVGRIDPAALQRITDKLLVNSTIQQVVTPDHLERLFVTPQAAPFSIEQVPLLQASDTVLQRISLDHQLSLNLEEMRSIQAYYRKQAREPALIELETLAQTWSEHCKHKTLRGPVVYTEEIDGRSEKKVIQSLLKETIVEATERLNRPWCVSVFSDNSGVIAFDDQYHLCFKVETHNHPSALEPFGGASTGVGGVIRDILGTGLGAKPIASTDVFCFAPPDFPVEQVPAGALQPRRVIKGVVAGVKDYGNKMGIPTVNGAVLFDERFVGNPLVYCGNVGLLPTGKVQKEIRPGMAAVVVGGKTGRDGVHGATFSSITLATESETISSTAVQIGDPITEKKTGDVLLIARDRELFSAVTDCGAGGLSSAVGEMGEACGARVDLEKVPLKYAGLTPTEIWISESQERMVLAVLPEKLKELAELFQAHGVDATVVGEFTGTGKLELRFRGTPVGELEMEFLHRGVPQFPRPARWTAPARVEPELPSSEDLSQSVLRLLSRWDSCSKEWIIRQYDHEVQGGSVMKPLALGPSDAAVLRPRLDSNKGMVLANGVNFRYGDLDPYWMAALAVDEAARQVAAVGGNLDHLAILDNFCWGDPTRVEVLGSLVRAAFGARDAALAYGTPFISGKDSLHNEYKMNDKTIQIPGTLLISAIGVLEDCARVVSMDAKRAGNFLYLAGITRNELGGSAYLALHEAAGGQVPRVDFKQGPALLRAVSKAAREGLAVAAHDCSEGGLALAAAEMAFAGGLGVTIHLESVPAEGCSRDEEILFSESASRILLEVAPDRAAQFEKELAGFPLARIGRWESEPAFKVEGLDGNIVIETPVAKLREAWELPFKGW